MFTYDYGNTVYSAFLLARCLGPIAATKLQDPEKIGDLVDAILGYLALEIDYPAPHPPSPTTNQLGHISKANAFYLEQGIKATYKLTGSDPDYLWKYTPAAMLTADRNS